MKNLLSSIWLRIVLMIVLGLILYGQTFDDAFHFDDHIYIIENRALRLAGDWAGTFKAILEFQPSRWVTIFTFAWNFWIHQLDTTGYHIINLAIHIACAMLVWGFGVLIRDIHERRDAKSCVSTTRKSKPTQMPTIPPSPLPYLAGLLFLVHPVHTQAVTYISQRCESLAALFFMGAVCLYLCGRDAINGASTSRKYFIAALIAGFFGMFTKESMIILPVMIIALEIFVVRAAFLRRPIHGSGASERRPYIFLIPIFLCTLIIPAMFQFNVQAMLFGAKESQSHIGDNLTFGTYVLTQLRVWITFLRLEFLPINLNLDYDFPMSHSLVDPISTLGSLIGLLCFFGGAWLFRKKNPYVALAALWFGIALLPYLIPRSHVIFEHKLYLVSAGFIPAMCLAAGHRMSGRRDAKFCVSTFMAIIVVIFSFLTFQRNRVWDNEISLWSDTVAKSPDKARPHLNLGVAYYRNGDHDRAMTHYNRAIAITPDAFSAYVMRAAVHRSRGDLDAALADIDRALKLHPAFDQAYIQRARIRMEQKQWNEALSDLNRAIQIRDLTSARKMRAQVYYEQFKYAEAYQEYEEILRRDPMDYEAYARRGYLNGMRGELAKALADFNRAIELNPDYAEGYAYRGMYYIETKDFMRARQDLKKALMIDPHHTTALEQLNKLP